MAFRALLILLCFIYCQANFLPFLEPPAHDGINRICKLTAENFTTITTASEIAVVIFGNPLKDAFVTKTPKCPSELDNFAQQTAQVLRKKNIIVCYASTAISSAEPGSVQYQPDDIYVYKNGNGKLYYGKRSVSALISFLFKVNDTQINVINGKLDKIAFDAVQETKVVGFFMKTAADYLAFEEAAAALSPSAQFYATFDRTVAKHLKLDTVGQIYLYKPLSKTPLTCPQNPATAADIEAFVTQTKGALLTKINEHNLYDPQVLDASKTLILAIAEQASPVGGYFYHLITRLVRNNTNNTEFEKINIVWVEPKLFPTIYLMMDELKSTLGTPNIFPAFGAINITTLQSSWLDTSTLNTTADKMADEGNVQILIDFLNGVINNTIIPIKLGIQAFVQSPSPKIAEAGSEVILDCVIENKFGDCLWLKDGHNIGFSLTRHPSYSWRGDTASGDCSLKITNVQKGRDDGEWICEVTGDLDSPTLTSQPVKLIVTEPSATKGEL